MKKDTIHAWCSQCGGIQPVVLDELDEGRMNSGDMKLFKSPKDIVCQICRDVLVTTYEARA